MFIITGFILPVSLFIVALFLRAGMATAQKALDEAGMSSSSKEPDEVDKAKQLAIKAAKKIINTVKVALRLIKSIIFVFEALTLLAMLALLLIIVLLIVAVASVVATILSGDTSTTSAGITGSSGGLSSSSNLEGYDKWFWVGDSRTVGLAESALGMSYTGGTNDTIINDSVAARVGQGYDWWVSPDMTSTREKVESLEGYNIVFNFGVNDLVTTKYTTYYTQLPDSFYEKNNVIFMSVNPVCHQKSGVYTQVQNSSIVQFNSDLKEAIKDKGVWVDTFKDVFECEVTDNGDTFKDVNMFLDDGLHYTSDTYKSIYDYTISKFTVSASTESTTDNTEPSTESS